MSGARPASALGAEEVGRRIRFAPTGVCELLEVRHGGPFQAPAEAADRDAWSYLENGRIPPQFTVQLLVRVAGRVAPFHAWLVPYARVEVLEG